MANPDISAITELNAGTLAFTIQTNQVTFLAATQEDAKVDSATTYDIGFELDDAADGRLSKHATFEDEFMLGFMIADSAMAGTPALTWQATGGDEAFTPMTGTDLHEGQGGNVDGSMFYLKNPTLNAGDLLATFGTGTENGSCPVLAFSHVDQTTPFKTQPWFDHAGKSGEDDHAVWVGMNPGYKHSPLTDNVGYTGLENNRRITNVSSATSTVQLRYDTANLETSNPYFYYGMMPMEMNPGDLIVGCFQPEDDSTRLEMATNVEWVGGTKSISAQQRSSYPFLGAYEGPGNKMPLIINRNDYPGGSGSDKTSILWYATLQSPQTKTTLFAGVAEYVIKLNQIYITNPSIQGIMVDIDVTGLTGSGTNFTTSGAADVITVTGSSATNPTDFSVCKGKFAQSHKAIPVLDRPIYLPATAGLKAKATHAIPHIEYLDRDVQVVVDFEVIGDA